MRQIRPLATESEFEAFAWIASNAYPGMKLVSDEDRQRLIQRVMAQQEASNTSVHGLFEGDRLLGGMRLHDFTMNLRSAKVGAGGVGFVAVDLLHKKQGVAKDMIAFFLRRCRERNQPIALLYPFRPDFYKQMGFGYGTKMSHYAVRPAHLPRGESRAHARLLGGDDKPLLAACYARQAGARHGLIEKTDADVDAMFAHPENRIVGCVEDGAVSGYLVFSFTTDRPDTFLVNDILVKELVYESRAALSELLEFLRTQADQIRRIMFNLQDDAFHRLLFDPRDDSEQFFATLYQQTNTQGVGIMYRAVDTRALFASLGGCDFGGQSCALKIAVRDSFVPENAGDVFVRFERGRPSVRDGDDYDIAIELDVAELSSLLMGVVSFRTLHRYGMAAISDERHIDAVTRLFAVEEKPICWTWF
jgi:predicted acetyltransferase